MTSPEISIVIPTWRSARTLRACLESIRNQGFGPMEIIIVDAGSDDGTVGIAMEYTDKVFVRPLPLSDARNFGFGRAGGSIFLSIDSDMVLGPGLLLEIARMLNGRGGNGGSAMGSAVIPEHGLSEGLLSRCKSLEKQCYLNDPLYESARAFTRPAFEAVGGYGKGLVFGEDRELHRRVASRLPCGRACARIFHDERRVGLLTYLRKAFRYGKTMHAYVRKEKGAASGRFDIRNAVFIRHFRLLAKEPLIGCMLGVVKGLEYSAGALGYAAGFLSRDGSRG
jgi:glycosyltransferase involved in cell wall biosynthesis